ncbi:MAG: M15 family metallopeptidase [Cyanobacteria bacterium J06626_23]
MKLARRFHPAYLLLLTWACLTVLLAHVALTQACLPSPLSPLMGVLRPKGTAITTAGNETDWGLAAAFQSVGQLGSPAVANEIAFGAGPTSASSTAASEAAIPERAQFLGHYAYAEIHPVRLMTVGSYTANRVQRFEKLDKATGQALMKMIDAARRDGVWVVPISGFRDIEEQGRLFDFTKERTGSLRRAAQSVAPPGYSEHHSGYAVDLGDGLARAKDVSVYFEETDAFQWLARRAGEFGFELSFPKDNDQGVTYEPWHWRYVGSRAAATTFGKVLP